MQPIDPSQLVQLQLRSVADIRLLVIEDDSGDAAYLSACLDELGTPPTSVQWARTLAGAAAPAAQQPDCILVDLGLPDASGMQAVDAMLQAAPSAAVIVLTGLDDPLVERALVSGAQDYLVKSGLTSETLARSVRYAVERKRAELVNRQLVQAQVQAAENRRLERGLLPTPYLTDERVRYATYYQPAHGHVLLGGDFYDVIERSDGSLRVTVGDVMGHGPDQAALGVHLRAGWRSLVLAGLPPDRVLEALATILATEAPRHWFVTVCDLLFSPDRRTLSIASFGHPAPVLATSQGVQYVPVPQQPPLGLTRAPAGTRFTTVELPEQWQLLLYTDGLLDRFRQDEPPDDIGQHGLLAAVAAADRESVDLQGWVAGILAASPQPVSDDVAVLALSFGR